MAGDEVHDAGLRIEEGSGGSRTQAMRGTLTGWLTAASETGGRSDGAGETFRMFLLDDAARCRELKGHDVIRLTLGKSDLPLHDAIKEAIVGAVRDPYKSNLVFPEGLPDLRDALVGHYSELAGEPIELRRVLVDAGTSSCYPSLFGLLAGPGDEVLLPLPYYPLYRVSTLMTRASVRHYLISTDTMRVNLESFARNITAKTRVVVVNSPGNPLGNVISPSELSAMLDMLPDEAHLVFDEIYENVPFGSEARLAPLLLTRTGRHKDRVIVTNSVSKAYRMYTKRVGWCVLPERLAEAMRVLLHHTRLTVDPAAQYGAIEALRRPEELEIVRGTHRLRWEHAWSRLQAIPGTRLLPSGGGFYCTLDCRDFMTASRFQNGLDLAINILDTVGVATVPGEDFGLAGTLRLSFTASRFEEAVDRLVVYFRNQR